MNTTKETVTHLNALIDSEGWAIIKEELTTQFNRYSLSLALDELTAEEVQSFRSMCRAYKDLKSLPEHLLAKMNKEQEVDTEIYE